MEKEMIFGAVAVLVFLLALVVVYNGIVRRFHAVDQAWSDVIATQRQFEQVVPSLESLSANYSVYESEILKSVVRLREAMQELHAEASTDTTSGVMRRAQELMQSLRVSVEAYPNLKTDQVVQKLMAEIARIQDNVAASVRIFNMNIAHHNAGLEAFPNNLVNSIFNRLETFEPFADELASSRFNYSPHSKQ